MENKQFKLFSFNVPVRGEALSAIYNLQDGCIYSIPTAYYQFLEANADDAGRHLPVMASFNRQLVEKGLGFMTSIAGQFPAMDQQFYANTALEKVIIEFSARLDFVSIARQLDALNCRFLEFRWVQEGALGIEAFSVLEHVEKSVLRSVNVVLNYSQGYDQMFFAACFERYKKIRNMVMLHAPEDKHIPHNEQQHIYYVKASYAEIGAQECLPVQPKLIVNRAYFCRARTVNAYYYGKLCIAQNGDIKNNLQWEDYVGNVNDMSLQTALADGMLTDIWQIGADQITNLQGDRFRYAKIISGKPLKQRNGQYTLLS